MKKGSTKSHNFRDNANAMKIDGAHLGYFVHMVKLDSSKVLQKFQSFYHVHRHNHGPYVQIFYAIWRCVEEGRRCVEEGRRVSKRKPG